MELLPPHGFVPRPDVYTSQNYLVLDFEVDVRDERFGSAIDRRNQLALACWKGKHSAVRETWGGELDQLELLIAIAGADFIVAHNAKYELQWLQRMGVDLERLVVFDTMVAEYVLAGNRASVDDKTGLAPLALDLDTCCRRRGLPPKDPIVQLFFEHDVPVRDIPRQWVAARCRQDVETTEALFLQQLHALRVSGRLNVVYTRCVLTPVLADIEKEGVKLDKARVQLAYDEFSSKLAELQREMDALTGGINWRSGKQVGEYLYDTLKFAELVNRRGEPKRTDGGQRSTDQKTLDALVATTDEQRQFIALRKKIGKVSAALTKNLNYFQHACETNDGLFRAQFNQTVTATHRLSSSGIPTDAGSVQFQNLPRAFKRLFTARRSGDVILEADGAQLEFRVAAFLGNDRQARADILDPDWDAHLTTASAMFRVPYADLLQRYRDGDKKVEEMRTEAKRETFKPLYGGNKGTPAQERWYKAFRERYPDLARVQEGWVAEVRQSKRLITPWGLRYYWPNARVNHAGYCNVTASVYNYPVQALATAEIIPVALTYLWHATAVHRGLGALRIVNTVHDSVVLELEPALLGELREIIIDSFTTKVYTYLKDIYGLDFDIPLGVGIKAGQFLGEAKEEAYNVFNDGRRIKLK